MLTIPDYWFVLKGRQGAWRFVVYDRDNQQVRIQGDDRTYPSRRLAKQQMKRVLGDNVGGEESIAPDDDREITVRLSEWVALQNENKRLVALLKHREKRQRDS